LPGDKVTVELTPYDLSRARIVFRAKWFEKRVISWKWWHRLSAFAAIARSSSAKALCAWFAALIRATNSVKA